MPEDLDPNLDPNVDPEPDPEPEPEEPDVPDPTEEDLPFLTKAVRKYAEKLGYVPKTDLEAANTRLKDNQTFARTLSERVARLEKPAQPKQTGPTSDELFDKWQAEINASADAYDPEKVKAAGKAYNAALKREASEAAQREADERIQKHLGDQSARQYESALNSELAKPENAGITREILDDFFSKPENQVSRPEEEVFLYRARQHKGGLSGYINDIAKAIARRPAGAPSAPVNTGGRQHQPSRILTKKELIDDYDGVTS